MKKPDRKTYSFRIDKELMDKARKLKIDINSLIEKELRKLIK